MKELTSKKYKGRLAGSEGNLLATKYIANYFEKIGLENPKGLEHYMNDYFQPLVELKDKPVLQVLNKKGKVTADFNYPENFVLRRLSSKTNRIDISAPMRLIDNIDMLYKNDGSLKGKIMLIPWKYYPSLGTQNEPVDFAQKTGALGVISEFNLKKNSLGYKYLKVRPLGRTYTKSDTGRPFAFVDSTTFSKLVNSAKTGGKLHFMCNSETDSFRTASNCIGLITGSNEKLKDEFIIIGAHFDHVGENMDGTWNPGALDNASGTAVMMELARLIKKGTVQPKKSILFMAFNGEESGINGSWSYCENPIYPLDKAVMVSLDMIGSATKLPLSIATSTSKSNNMLRDTMAAYAEKLSIIYKKEIDDGSDHSAFDYRGVPSVCLANLDLAHGYHSPHDTIETISVDRLKEIAKLVLYYIEKNAY
jgi:aminopeptidase YwaD